MGPTPRPGENLEVFGHLEETGDPVFESSDKDNDGDNPYVVRFDERGGGPCGQEDRKMTGGSGEKIHRSKRPLHWKAHGPSSAPSSSSPFYPFLFPGDNEYLPAFLDSRRPVRAGRRVHLVAAPKPDGADRMDRVGRNSLTVVFARCYGFVLGRCPWSWAIS